METTMKASEREILNRIKQMLDGEISTHDFSFEMEDYLVDDTDQLEIDNPRLYDFLQDDLPELVVEDFYKPTFLPALRKIYEHALTLVTE